MKCTQETLCPLCEITQTVYRRKGHHTFMASDLGHKHWLKHAKKKIRELRKDTRELEKMVKLSE